MRRPICTLSKTVILLALLACKPESPEPSAQPSKALSLLFEQAVLREGQAFGEWPLNKITYKQVLEKLGPTSTISKSDVSESSCHPYPDCKEEKYTRVSANEGEFTFYFEHLKPGWVLDNLRLEAVKVECFDGCHFKGLTGKGIRIGDSREKVQQVYGKEMIKSEEWKASCYRSGICFDFDTRGQTPKVYTLLVLSPERLLTQ